MNRWLLTVVLLLTLAGSAFAQSQQVQNMGGWYRNPQNGQITDSYGNVLGSDAFRDRDFKVWSTPVRDSIARLAADSTVAGPFYTGQAARLWLRVQVTWPYAVHDSLGETQKFCKFAVQVRGHLTTATDSLNTNPWWMYADSLRTASFPVAAATRGYRGVTAGTVPSQTIALPTEMMFEAYRPALGTGAQGSNLFGEPCNFWIPLADARGVYFWAPYTSVRVRVIENYDTNASTHPFNQPKFVVDLVGTAK